MDSEEISNRKRARNESDGDDSVSDSPELKRVRLDSYDSGANSTGSKEARVASDGDGKLTEFHDSLESDDSGVNSPDAKRIQEDLLDILDDPDEPVVQGLDSVIKSFEEEMLVPMPVTVTTPAVEVMEQSYSSQPDLGFLLEASDDELGLPPSFSSGDEERIDSTDLSVAVSEHEAGNAPVVLGEMLGFEDPMPSYDTFDFGLGCNNSYNNDSEDFVALGGLFDHSDENIEPADRPELQWQQPESLSAL